MLLTTVKQVHYQKGVVLLCYDKKNVYMYASEFVVYVVIILEDGGFPRVKFNGGRTMSRGSVVLQVGVSITLTILTCFFEYWILNFCLF